MKREITAIDIVKLESRADAFAERMKLLEARQDKLESRQELMETRQDKQETRQDLLDIKLKPAFTIANIAIGVITTSVIGVLIYIIATAIASRG